MQVSPSLQSSGEDYNSLYSLINSRVREEITIPISNLSIDENTGQLNTYNLPLTSFSAKQLAKKVGIPPQFIINTTNEISAYNFNKLLPTASGNVILTIEQERIVSIINENKNNIDPKTLVDKLSDINSTYPLTKWNVSETGIKLRIISDSNIVTPKVNDIVKYGSEIMIRENSEVGLGIRGLLFRLICTNGAVANENINARRDVRNIDWINQNERSIIAANAARDTCALMEEYGNTLPIMAQVSVPFSELLDDERNAFIKKLLRQSSVPTSFVGSVSEALRSEENSLFGWYNALTRLGRDSSDLKIKETFERGGFKSITNISKLIEVTEGF